MNYLNIGRNNRKPGADDNESPRGGFTLTLPLPSFTVTSSFKYITSQIKQTNKDNLSLEGFI
jgi:hypothetical protein